MHAFKIKRQMQMLGVLLGASREAGRCWKMDEGRVSSDEAALHLGDTSNRLSVRVRVSQSRLLSSNINWTPKTEHIFGSFMPRNLRVSLFLQKVNEWKGRKF
jgi:hypothetical protein